MRSKEEKRTKRGAGQSVSHLSSHAVLPLVVDQVAGLIVVLAGVVPMDVSRTYR